MKIPTDLELLKYIFEKYKYASREIARESTLGHFGKMYVHIDIDSMARKFKTNREIIYGRFENYLRPKYTFINKLNEEEEITIHIFESHLYGETDLIYFPLLTSILAEMQEEKSKNDRTVRIAILAVIISLLSVLLRI